MKSSALFVAIWFAFSYLSVSGAIQYQDSINHSPGYDRESHADNQDTRLKDVYFNWIADFYGIPQ